MKTVYKYLVEERVALPKCAKILTVHAQNQDVWMWAEVETDNPTQMRCFDIHGTGHDISISVGVKKYVGTVFMENGLVWHVYEII